MIHYGKLLSDFCKASKYGQKEIANDLNMSVGGVQEMFRRPHQTTKTLLFFEKKLGLHLLVKKNQIISEPLIRLEINEDADINSELNKKLNELVDMVNKLYNKA